MRRRKALEMRRRKALERLLAGVVGLLWLWFSPVVIIAQTGAVTPKQSPKTKVQTHFDNKRNKTHALIGPFELWKPPQNSVSGETNYEHVDLTVSFSYPGKKIAKPEFVTLMLLSSSEGGPEFHRKRDLIISTESDRKDFGQMELVGTSEGRASRTAFGVLTLVVREVLTKDIPLEDFERLAASQKADLRIGDRKFKLTNAQLQAFRNFVSLMKQEGLEF
jgi:hypothetical protein